MFDLNGTLVDNVYQHVLAWRSALEAAGIDVAVWRIHRTRAFTNNPAHPGPPRDGIPRE